MYQTAIVNVSKNCDRSKARFLIKKAVEFLQDDLPVAIPTETVYGLAANALSSKAVDTIFQAKRRPSDNPLIVHVSSLEMLKTFIKNNEIPPQFLPIIEEFWPGPLTLLFKKVLNFNTRMICFLIM